MEQYRLTQLRRLARAAVVVRDAPSGSELTLSAMALGWAVILCVYPDGLARLPSFAPMSALAPQPVWAGAFFAAAAVVPVGVLTGWRVFRLVALVFHSFTWAFLAVVILASTPFAAGWWIYGCLAVRSCWAAWVVAQPGGR